MVCTFVPVNAPTCSPFHGASKTYTSHFFVRLNVAAESKYDDANLFFFMTLSVF